MRARIYLNGKRITKKKAMELFGNEKVEKRIQEAEESFINDQYIENIMKMSIIIIATNSCKDACSFTQFLKSFLYKHLKIVLINTPIIQ